MPKKKSTQKDNLSPIEKLFSGQVGPLPIDNDVWTPGVGPEHISPETPPAAPDDPTDLIDYIMKHHPGLSREEVERLIDGFE